MDETVTVGRGRKSHPHIVCPHCHYGSTNAQWRTTACPKCGLIHHALYRRDHLDPERAKTMTDSEIERELSGRESA